MNKISCRFIDELSDEFSEKIFYKNIHDAYTDAKKGKLIAILHFKWNYTESFHAGFIEDVDQFAPERNNQFIDFYIDRTDFQLFVFLERRIYSTYDNYSRNLMKDCGYKSRVGSSPVSIETPIFGNVESNFKLMMAPIVLMVSVFFTSMTANAASICDDRKNGLWNRTLLAGVTTTEIMASHVVVQLFFNFMQILEMFAFLSLVLQTSDLYKLSLISLLLTLLLIAGIFAGAVLAIGLGDQTKSLYMQSFLTNISVTISGEICCLIKND